MARNGQVKAAAKTTVVEQPSFVQEVADKLINAIRDGRLVPGQRLVARDLAEEFGVSRAPVREALHILAGEGIIELVPNRGAKVRRLSDKEIIDLLEFRETICLLGLRLAARQMDKPENRGRADTALARIEAAATRRSPFDLINGIYEYHNTLNDIGGNRFVAFVYSRATFYLYNRALSEWLPGGNWDHFMKSYRAIHKAVINGDGDGASAEFRAYMEWVMGLAKAHQAAHEARP